MVDRKDFPGHLLDIEIKVVVDRGFAGFPISNCRVYAGLTEHVVKSVWVVCPTDGVKIVPRLGGWRKQKLPSLGLLNIVNPDSNPVPVSEAAA